MEGRPLEEAELIDRARRGDVMAYEELVRRHQDVALRAAWLIAPDGDADDACQEAFVKAWAALPRFRTGSPFRPWLLRIVTNEARNRAARPAAGAASRCAPPRTAPRAMRLHRPSRRSSTTSRAPPCWPRSTGCATRTAR